MWYAAYGSNLDRARMLCYVQGGCPPGAARTYAGCLDPAPPRAARAMVLSFPLFFAGRSSVWDDCGVAFVGTRRDPPAGTFARAWLVTSAQFADIVRQENGGAPTGEPLDLSALTTRGELTLGAGWYEHLLLCGVEGGVPVVTATAAAAPAPVPPSPAYVQCMVEGLMDSHALSEADARAYVAARIRP